MYDARCIHSYAQAAQTEKNVYYVARPASRYAMRNRRDRGKERNLLISVGTDASRLIILGAIIIGAVVEGAVPLSHRPASSLIHKVPIEARERSVLCAFALYEEGTLVDAELLQVSGMRIHRARHYFSPVLGGCHAPLPPRCLRRRHRRHRHRVSISLSFFLSSFIHVFLRIVGRARRVVAYRPHSLLAAFSRSLSLSLSLSRSLSHSHSSLSLSLYPTLFPL